jgi:hypothetical protein
MTNSTCNLWPGATNGRYGHVCRNRNGVTRYFKAHRIAWADANGWDYWDMTSDMVIRHLCDQPLCVNPDHLVLGTQRDNMRDASDKGRIHNQSKTHCPQGHEYVGDNLVIERNKRICRTCRNEGKRRKRLANA